MMYRGAGTLIYHIKNKKIYILLIERKFNPFKYYWSIFGGKSEKNESFKRTAYRELLEELKFKKSFLLKNKRFLNFKKEFYDFKINFLFYFRTYFIESKIMFSNKDLKCLTEFYNIEWFSIDDVFNIEKIHPGVLKSVLLLQNCLHKKENVLK